MAKKTVKDLDVKGKKVLVRVDFNVPIKNGVITDDNRITAALPTLKYILENGGKVIAFSHLGKIKAEEDKASKTLAPVAKRLEEVLGKPVKFIPETRGAALEAAISELKDFKGTDIVAITRESITKITGLEQQEAAKFLNQLFSSTTKEGIVKLDNKVVLYKINNSKMAEYNKSKDEVVKGTIKQLQEEELMTNLLKRLENTFEIQSSLQEKE